MLKIIHCADIHLDSPFSKCDASEAVLRRRELLSVFRSLMSYIRREAVDICLLAGDLFDCEFVTRDTLETVLAEFALAKDCFFYLSPGNHDPYQIGGIYDKVTFPENVHIFRSPSFECVAYDENVDVYGYAFTDSVSEENRFLNVEIRDPNKLNLAVCHGDLDVPLSKYAPILTGDLEKCGFDYVAIGHIHTKGKGITPYGSTYAGYCGCLQGRDFGETGYKGAYLITYADPTEKTPEIKFLRFAQKRFEQEEIDISRAESMSAVQSLIDQRISEKDYGSDTYLRMDLIGSVSADFAVRENASFDANSRVHRLTVRNRTNIAYDPSALEKDATVRGKFYNTLKPLLEGEEEERILAAMALRYGLAALAGNDLPD